jgi:hypothetical protein
MAYSVTLSGTSLVFPIEVYQGIKMKKAKYKKVQMRANKTFRGVTGSIPSQPKITKLITKIPSAHLNGELL